MRYLLAMFLALPAGAQNLSEPQYNLPGQDYSQESSDINQMFRNVAGDIQAVKKSISLIPTTTTTSASSSTIVAWVLVSSGAGVTNSFSFVTNSTVSYRLDYRITQTSGTTSTASPWGCKVNSNSTAAKYRYNGQTYQNAYSYNDGGGLTYWPMKACGGGAVNGTDFSNGTWQLASSGGSAVTYTGTRGESCQTRAVRNTVYDAGFWLGSGPWTIVCGAQVASIGLEWEYALYQASAVVVGQGPKGDTGATGATGATGLDGAGVLVSSWTVNLAGKTVTQTPTAYNIALDTITVTLSASYPVSACCYGSLSGTGASNVLSWGLLVDSAFPSGLSATIGKGVQFMASSSERANVSDCHVIAPNVLSAGSHTFAFMPSCNTSNACTIGGATTPKTTFFCGVRQP